MSGGPAEAGEAPLRAGERSHGVSFSANEPVARLLARAEHRETLHAGGRVTWRCWGAGALMLLLHGSHGGWMHWVRNIDGLAASRRLIVPDLPGFGDSDPPADRESPHAHAALIADGLAEITGTDARVDVVGFSLGALIGCLVAAHAPERVRRLVLIGAGGLGAPMRFPELRSPRGVPLEQRRAINRHNLAAFMLHDPAAVDDLAIDIGMHYGPLTRTRVQFHVVPDKLLGPLSGISAPVDLIWGEHDYPHPDPEANAAVVRRLHPEVRLRIIAGAGHWAMYERPVAFNTALLELLGRPPDPFRS